MVKEIEANLCFAIFGKNSKIQNGRHSLDTLWVENFDKIALSRTVSEILRFFRFSQKFKMAAKSGENSKFSILYRLLLYYPVSQKLCRNRSISYGFRDIKILSFFAKN